MTVPDGTNRTDQFGPIFTTLDVTHDSLLGHCVVGQDVGLYLYDIYLSPPYVNFFFLIVSLIMR